MRGGDMRTGARNSLRTQEGPCKAQELDLVGMFVR